MQLHLHVGHGKTGSSFLQSWWALNRPGLWQAAQLLYPAGEADQRAQAGAFSMGNGQLLDQVLPASTRPRELRQWWTELLQQQPEPREGGPQAVLFSAERWARHLPSQPEALLRVADAGGIGKIRIWLLVRDPLDHAASVYGQMVKRHGFTGSLDDWLAIYDFPRVLLTCLDTFQGQPDRFSLEVDHYGRQRHRLLERMQAWLQLPVAAEWQQPAQTMVNRSLSSDELLLMRWLNARLGDQAAAVGEQLVDRLPGLAPARLQASARARDQFAQRWVAVVEEINQRLPASARLQLNADAAADPDPPDPAQPPQAAIRLLPGQLDCLLDGLQRLVQAPTAPPPGVRQRLKRWLTQGAAR